MAIEIDPLEVLAPCVVQAWPRKMAARQIGQFAMPSVAAAHTKDACFVLLLAITTFFLKVSPNMKKKKPFTLGHKSRGATQVLDTFDVFGFG